MDNLRTLLGMKPSEPPTYQPSQEGQRVEHRQEELEKLLIERMRRRDLVRQRIRALGGS